VPLILFSHGLGGSLDAGTTWARAWSDAGFAVIHLQHPGSDRAILRSGELRAAMSGTQLAARAADVRFVLDEIPRNRREGDCDLSRLDLGHVGMSGHSFGAHTTLAVAGQRFGATRAGAADPRIDAAIVFSPAPPMAGSDEQAFGDIRIPVFSLTGTRDSVPLTPTITPEDRERPFRAMPPGGKYLLVMSGANHAAFSGGGGFARAPADPHVDSTVTAATLAFWRWTLMGDAAARRLLDDPDGLAASLAPGDRLVRR